MSQPTQNRRQLSFASPLGRDVLLIQSMDLTEALSKPFECDIELASGNNAIDFATILGQNVTVRLNVDDGSFRYVNGYVAQISQTSRAAAMSTYWAMVVPWLWFLTRTSNSRTFHRQTAVEVIKDVFASHGMALYDDRLTGSYPKREYCVQYQESDFAFVCRLMEQEGIYYFFEHADKVHTLVLCDDASRHRAVPGHATLAYRSPDDSISAATHLFELTVKQEVQPGQFATTNYDYMQPRKLLTANATPTVPPANANAGSAMFEFPGRHLDVADGQRYAQVRLDELQARFETYAGRTDSRAIAAGSIVAVTGYARDEWNQGYLITSTRIRIASDAYAAVRHGDEPSIGNGDGGGAFTCSFEAIRKTTQFRPPRTTRRPVIQGVQSALVVGQPGKELDVDPLGRVQVQFPWDRYGRKNQHSSCQIRVAQSVAGSRWGASFWPRYGQEVLVVFIEGDPDQPIIIGSAYNGDNLPPYLGGGPDPKHANDSRVSGIKTNSTPGGYGFNELRIDDTSGQEQVFIHAQESLDIRARGTAKETVGGDRHTTVGWSANGRRGGDHHHLVHRDQHLTVERDQVERVAGNLQLRVGGGDGGGGNVDLSFQGQKTETVGGGSDLHVGGDRRELVGGDDSITVGGSLQARVGIKHAVEAGQEIHLKSGAKLVLEAGSRLTLRAGSGFVDISSAGVVISGSVVLLNSGGTAGMGSGSNPVLPTDAQQANPVPPVGADDGVSGQRSVIGPPPPAIQSVQGEITAQAAEAYEPPAAPITGGTAQAADAGDDADGTPPATTAPASAKVDTGILHQVGGFGDGAWDAGKGMMEGASQLVAHPVNTYNAMRNVTADQLFGAVVKPYQDAVESGEYGKALGRATVEIGSLLVGAGEADVVATAAKAGEAAEAVGKVGKLGEVADATAGAERVAEATEVRTAGDAAKSGEAGTAETTSPGKVDEPMTSGGDLAGEGDPATEPTGTDGSDDQGGQAAQTAATPLTKSARQLQKKFDKHASDFGVQGNYSQSTADAFSDAIDAHVASPDTQVIQGEYRGNPATLHVDPNTGLNVIADPVGNFVSGWKLSPQQLQNVLTKGKLGGG